jgi:hypothetical protein
VLRLRVGGLYYHIAMDDDRFTWNDVYAQEAQELLYKHFSGYPARAFPTMRVNYRSKKLPELVEPRTVLKNNHEYHAMETYAWQFHVSGMYAKAYEHFLMAAAWRACNDVYVAEVAGIVDRGHVKAIEHCLRHALFNKALSERRQGLWPTPEQFGIDVGRHAARESMAEAELEAAYRETESSE